MFLFLVCKRILTDFVNFFFSLPATFNFNSTMYLSLCGLTKGILAHFHVSIS
jgi:hypothetical protein